MPSTADNLKVKRAGRRRRAAGWVLFALGALVTGVWVASGWFYLDFYRGGASFSLRAGTLDTYKQELEPPATSASKAKTPLRYSRYDQAAEMEHAFRKAAAEKAGERELGAFRYSTRLAAWRMQWFVAERKPLPDLTGGKERWGSWSFYLISRSWYFNNGGWKIVLWPISFLLWPPAALLLRSGLLARQRANTNACPTCGYPLAGLAPNSPCPECGTSK